MVPTKYGAFVLGLMVATIAFLFYGSWKSERVGMMPSSICAEVYLGQPIPHNNLPVGRYVVVELLKETGKVIVEKQTIPPLRLYVSGAPPKVQVGDKFQILKLGPKWE